MAAEIWSEETAQRYDADAAEMSTAAVLEPTARFLAELAGGGQTLEFAIGTGRVALPLTARGVPVTGTDQSPAMVARLRAKPGGGQIPVVIGDMATAHAAGTFSLVYLVFNTISNLLEQSEQIACFRNAAAHLEPGGAFVVELGIPDLRRLPPGKSALVFHHDERHIGIDTYDVAAQRLTSHHYRISEVPMSLARTHHRHAWPAELDLMAQLAGLHLVERWADWDRAPFTSDSTAHVSVYRCPA